MKVPQNQLYNLRFDELPKHQFKRCKRNGVKVISNIDTYLPVKACTNEFSHLFHSCRNAQLRPKGIAIKKYLFSLKCPAEHTIDV